MKTHQILTAAVVLTASLSACGGGGTPTPSITSIELSPSAASVTVGQTTTLTAIARDASGNQINGVNFTWKSNTETVATVAAGVVKGIAAGSTQVTASASGVTSNAATVTVTPPAPVAGFTLSLSENRLPVTTGTSAFLTVNVTRTGGFTGAVTVNLTGLPSGATSSPVTIAAGSSSATVTVTAAANAPHSLPTAATLTGTATNVGNASAGVTVTVRGPAGSLDTTFGAGGVRQTQVGTIDDASNGVTVQSDGKVIVVGSAKNSSGGTDFSVVRYTRDGTLDGTFGPGGKVLVDFAGMSDEAEDVVVQPNGAIVVAGYAGEASTGRKMFGVVRLTATGSLDTSFGTGGRVTTKFPGSSSEQAHALVLQSDGKIVLGGETTQDPSGSGVDFALARYTTTGALDTSFDTDGMVTTAMGAGSASDVVYDLALLGDQAVAVGTGFKAARYTTAGQVDWKTILDYTGPAKGVAVDASNRLVLVGDTVNSGTNVDTTVVRLTGSGALDTSFGNLGKANLAVASCDWDSAEGVAVQNDGKLVVAGWCTPLGLGSVTDTVITRLNTDGSLDFGFGNNGRTILSLAANNKYDQANAVALQPDDRIPATRIVVAGDITGTSGSSQLVLRLWE